MWENVYEKMLASQWLHKRKTYLEMKLILIQFFYKVHHALTQLDRKSYCKTLIFNCKSILKIKVFLKSCPIKNILHEAVTDRMYLSVFDSKVISQELNLKAFGQQ